MRIEVFIVKYVQYIPRSVFNRNQTQQDLQINPIWITDSDHDYIIGEIILRDQIEYERKINIEDTYD